MSHGCAEWPRESAALAGSPSAFPYAGAVKVREPVARPLDVVAVELILSASQAFLVGVLLYLALGIWDERGMSNGPVAVVLVLLALAVGGGWGYWLLGGVGWPMAAANVPVSMFLGFALVLGWTGGDLFAVTGVPLLLATLAALYGIIGGVFVDSPRRWRWDQRQRPRPGTQVPHVSATTRGVVAAVPRSVPRRAPPSPPPASDLAARIEKSTPPSPGPSADAGAAYIATEEAILAVSAEPDDEADFDASTADATRDGPEPVDPPDEAPDEAPVMPTRRLAGVAQSSSSKEPAAAVDAESGGIVLPTSIEPKAQRSPWAWAAPPAWNRDEDDEGAARRPSGRS